MFTDKQLLYIVKAELAMAISVKDFGDDWQKANTQIRIKNLNERLEKMTKKQEPIYTELQLRQAIIWALTEGHNQLKIGDSLSDKTDAYINGL